MLAALLATAIMNPAPEAPIKNKLVEAGKFSLIYDAATGEKEPWCLNDHCFIKGPDHKWHMFGITHVKPFRFNIDPGKNLAHATADTLTQSPWKKEPFAMTADFEKHGELLFWAPHIVKNGDIYYMFVCAGSPDHGAYRIHVNTSKDLWSWKRESVNPIVTDGFDGRDPMVIRDGDRWILYYTATSTPKYGNHVVKAITSPDLLRWGRPRIVFTHDRKGDFAGPTESPFVVRRGKSYYLFCCDGGTINVYQSGDPYEFSYYNRVGEIFAHASEIIRDEKGKWYISHVGWQEGPLSIAPLKWLDGLDKESSSIEAAPK